MVEGDGRSLGGSSNADYRAASDRLVGRRIKLRRFLLQIERDHLAADVGIPASTLARIEAGDERAGPAVLTRIAGNLGAGMSWFFCDFSERSNPSSGGQRAEFTQSATHLLGVGESMLELLDQFMQVTDPIERETILEYARACAARQRD